MLIAIIVVDFNAFVWYNILKRTVLYLSKFLKSKAVVFAAGILLGIFVTCIVFAVANIDIFEFLGLDKPAWSYKYVAAVQIYVADSEQEDGCFGTDCNGNADNLAETYRIILQSNKAKEYLETALSENDIYSNLPKKDKVYMAKIDLPPNSEVLKISVYSDCSNTAEIVCKAMIDTASKILTASFEGATVHPLQDVSVRNN